MYYLHSHGSSYAGNVQYLCVIEMRAAGRPANDIPSVETLLGLHGHGHSIAYDIVSRRVHTRTVDDRMFLRWRLSWYCAKSSPNSYDVW